MTERESQDDPAAALASAEAIEAYLASARDGGDIEVMSEAQVSAAHALNRHGIPAASLEPWVAEVYPTLSVLAAHLAAEA